MLVDAVIAPVTAIPVLVVSNFLLLSYQSETSALGTICIAVSVAVASILRFPVLFDIIEFEPL